MNTSKARAARIAEAILAHQDGPKLAREVAKILHDKGHGPKLASRWKQGQSTRWARTDLQGARRAFASPLGAHSEDAEWGVTLDDTQPHGHAFSLDEAKSRADAMLVADGWTLSE